VQAVKSDRMQRYDKEHWTEVESELLHYILGKIWSVLKITGLYREDVDN